MANKASRLSAMERASSTLILHTPMRLNRVAKRWTRADMVARHIAQREASEKTAEVAKQMEPDRKYTTRELLEKGAE